MCTQCLMSFGVVDAEEKWFSIDPHMYALMKYCYGCGVVETVK